MIIRVALLFALLAALARISRGTMWIAFVGTAFAAGPLLGMGMQESLTTLLDAALSVSTLRLLLFVESIILLSGLMRRVGALGRLGDAVRAALGSARGGVALLPALVGLLPMPGGALFSAPLVDAAATGSSISPTRRAVANYWFRHTWEFWWPLYPGIIAAVELSGIPWSLWTTRMFLVTPVAALLGWFLILGRPPGEEAVSKGRSGAGALLREMLPILLIPALAAFSHLISLAWPRWRPESTWLLLASVWASIAVVLLQSRARPREILHSLNLRMVSMGVLILALMAYKGVITGSGMAESLEREFSGAHLPALPIASAIACVGGLVTGIAVGFVGSTFPIIASLLTAAPLEFPSAMGIAFLWGWVGMMLSPLHLCLLVTKEHFRADWFRMYALLVPLTILTAVTGTLGLAVFGGREGTAAAREGVSLDLAATVRRGTTDRVVTLSFPGGSMRDIPRGARQQRWPAFAPGGEYLAYLEGDRFWRLMVLPAGDQPVIAADSLSGGRLWAAWSPGAQRLAVSCVTLSRGRCILLWEHGVGAAVVPGTIGARCPFWRGDTLHYLAPRADGWLVGGVSPEAAMGQPWRLLPPYDPREAAVSPDGATLAYVGVERDEQPPRNRLLVADLARAEVEETGPQDEDRSAPAWDGADLLFLARSGKNRRLVRRAPDGSETTVTPIADPLVGVEIVPPVRLFGGAARPSPGQALELVLVRWDGSLLHRLGVRGADMWGLSAVSPSRETAP
ncbi:MAG: DUF401 family protein [Candidatus Eisenbacteria bacterium]|jgi:hypothetical protein|nr:DUF401 family protein [Candidatus Eisenbacteria bacterium]